jgi:hypothetical protein
MKSKLFTVLAFAALLLSVGQWEKMVIAARE